MDFGILDESMLLDSIRRLLGGDFCVGFFVMLVVLGTLFACFWLFVPFFAFVYILFTVTIAFWAQRFCNIFRDTSAMCACCAFILLYIYLFPIS